jgi:hypothetical protein
MQQVYLIECLPLRLGRLFEWTAGCQMVAQPIDQDVCSAEPGVGCLHEPIDTPFLREIAHDTDSLPPVLPHTFGNLPRSVTIDISDDHIGPVFSEQRTYGATDTSSASGDNRDFPVQQLSVNRHAHPP